MNKKLKKQIEKTLDQLSEILDNITEAQNIDPNDPDTWDVDALYDLAEQLKEALTLLEDEEKGLLELIDTYQDEDEEEDYD